MPAREVYLGIDLGTTALKAALFEARSGRLIAAAGHRLNVRVLPAGEREQDAAGVLTALARTLAGLKSRAGGRWSSVAGVGFASQGGSAVIADRRTGKALSPLWPWNDSRPYKYLPAVQKRLGRAFWRGRTMRDDPGAGLGRMLWLKETHPRLVRRDMIYAGAGEYVTFHLTGAWRQDAGSALQVGCYDARRRRLMREPLDAVGVTPDFVAPMRDGHALLALSPEAARKYKLPAGIPFAGPYMDHEAGYMAAACVSPRPLQCSLGTAWVGNLLMPEDAKWTSPYQLVIPSPVGEGWQVVQPLLTGNVSWDWALATFANKDAGKALARAGDAFRKSMWTAGQLTCIPWLGVPNPLVEGPFGAGVFQGVQPATTAADMLKALAAGMVFEFYRIFREIHERRAVDSVVLGGGAAGGAFFRMAFAALFSPIPAYAFVDHDYAGARGAIWPFDRAAAAARVRRVPAPPRGVRNEARERFDAYQRVFNAIYRDVARAAPIRFGRG